MINMIGEGEWFGDDIRVFRENIIFIKSYFAFKKCFFILRIYCKWGLSPFGGSPLYPRIAGKRGGLGSKPFTPPAGKKGFFPKIFLFLGTYVSGNYNRLD